MELVAARAGVGAHDARRRLAELRVVILSCNLRLFDGIETGIHDDDSQNRILIVSSVQFVTCPAEVLTVDKNLFAALRILRGRVSPSSKDLGAWSQQFQALEVPIVEREFLELFSGELG